MCSGSFGEPGERPQRMTFLPTARCDACENFVEIHPIEPGTGEDVRRLEAHDAMGRTLRLREEGNPDADCLTPHLCEKCGAEYTLRLSNAAPDVRAGAG